MRVEQQGEILRRSRCLHDPYFHIGSRELIAVAVAELVIGAAQASGRQADHPRRDAPQHHGASDRAPGNRHHHRDFSPVVSHDPPATPPPLPPLLPTSLPPLLPPPPPPPF